MEDTTPKDIEEQRKIREEFNPENNDVLKVGEIVLSSRYYLVNDLIFFFKEMLKDKNIKEYLDMVKRKTKEVGYLG